MNRIRITYKFILHFLTAKNTLGFGVHSPYVFNFTNLVIYNKGYYYIFSNIEKLRSELKKDKTILNYDDFGTGKKRNKTIAEITSKSLKPAKYGQLLYKLSDYIKAQNILELGTSLGLTTTYLASPSSVCHIVSMEGSTQIANVAINNFKLLNIKNVQIEVGNIDITLSKVLSEFDSLDLIFIDANHKSLAVLSYFEQMMTKIHGESVIVIDDIYWSRDMENAWGKIKEHPKVMSTIDLFHMGIVLFNSNLNKTHYKMRF